MSVHQFLNTKYRMAKTISHQTQAGHASSFFTGGIPDLGAGSAVVPRPRELGTLEDVLCSRSYSVGSSQSWIEFGPPKASHCPCGISRIWMSWPHILQLVKYESPLLRRERLLRLYLIKLGCVANHSCLVYGTRPPVFQASSSA